MLINTQGIVLRETKFNDLDKILTILTKKNGKVQSIAKGSRRPKSRLMPSTNVFCYSDLILYKGRNFYHMNQGDIINSFYSLRNDLEKLAYASYIVELVDFGMPELEQNDKVFNLLLKTLLVLSHMEKDYLKLVYAFEIKYISFIGYRPQLDSCVNCGTNIEEFLGFSVLSGGVLCKNCINREKSVKKISNNIQQKLKALLYIKLDCLEEISLTVEEEKSIGDILHSYIIAHIDKRIFNSLKVLKAIK